MKDRSGAELQLGDHVVYYRLKDGSPSGHVGVVVMIEDDVRRVKVKLDPGTRDAAKGSGIFATNQPERTLQIDKRIEFVTEATPKPKHVMGLDPEQISWAAHRAFLAERR